MNAQTTYTINISEIFEKNRFEQIVSALEMQDVSSLRKLAMAVRAEYIDVHDGFRDTIALTLAYLARTYGIEQGERLGRRYIEEAMQSGDPPQYSQPDLKERVRAVAAGWYWHATRFTLSEDDEKVTFLLHPCGSGMRIIKENYYPPNPWGPPDSGAVDAPLTLSDSPSWSTAMNKDYPIYCNHCPEMTHMALKNNSPTFLVESWTPLRKQGLCIQHTYKDISFVPEEFYHRAELSKPDLSKKTDIPKRLFTPEELIDLQKHPLDKLIDLAESGDIGKARDALDECYLGWRDSIHDIYRAWMSGLWGIVYEELGERAFEATVRATAPNLFAHIRGGDCFAWAAFWSIHLRLHSIYDYPDLIEFQVGIESLLQPGAKSFVPAGYLPYTPDRFVDLLNQGLSDRGWEDVGSFTLADSMLIHRLPKL